jgi:hypothetical protein
MVAVSHSRASVAHLSDQRKRSFALDGTVARVRSRSAGGGDVRHLAPALERRASARELKEQARRVLHLVERFRFYCRRKASSAQLAEIVDIVIPASRRGFDLAVSARAGDIDNADECRCQEQLARLLHDLRMDRPLPADELDHVMDSIIVECVRWDASTGEGIGLRSRR